MIDDGRASKPKKFDILCLPPQDKPVYFIVESRMGDDMEVNSYRFEEGDCPTNFFLNGVEAIITGGDDDPHGLFEHVGSFTGENKQDGTPTEQQRADVLAGLIAKDNPTAADVEQIGKLLNGE